MAKRLSAHVPTEPFGQQQQFWEAETGPCTACLGMKAARDDFYDVARTADKRFH